MSYCELPEFYAESAHIRTPRGRKPIKCCETHRVIAPGERYWKIRAKWDGEFKVLYQSDAAYHFARHLNKVDQPGHYECEIPFGGVAEWLADAGVGDGRWENDEYVKALRDEWERVKRGEVTRDTTTKGVPVGH